MFSTTVVAGWIAGDTRRSTRNIIIYSHCSKVSTATTTKAAEAATIRDKFHFFSSSILFNLSVNPPQPFARRKKKKLVFLMIYRIIMSAMMI